MLSQVNKNSAAVVDTDWSIQAVKTMTFTDTVNGAGDYDGTGNPATLFTVAGAVLMKIGRAHV